jgi:hypothetical protein
MWCFRPTFGRLWTRATRSKGHGTAHKIKLGLKPFLLQPNKRGWPAKPLLL